MGTNYYLQYASKMWDNANNFFLKHKDEIQCNSQIHIGKSSAGWSFTFRKYDTDELKVDTYKKWKEIISSEEYEIVDEYGILYDKDEFFSFVEAMQNDKHDYDYCELSKDGYDFIDHEFF